MHGSLISTSFFFFSWGWMNLSKFKTTEYFIVGQKINHYCIVVQGGKLPKELVSSQNGLLWSPKDGTKCFHPYLKIKTIIV